MGVLGEGAHKSSALFDTRHSFLISIETSSIRVSVSVATLVDVDFDRRARSTLAGRVSHDGGHELIRDSLSGAER